MSKSLIETLADMEFKWVATDNEWVIYEAPGNGYNEVVSVGINSFDGAVTIDRKVVDSDAVPLWINMNQSDPVIEVILSHFTR